MPFNQDESAANSGVSPAALPLKSSAQGSVEAPPGVDHMKAQLRLMSCPTHLLPEVV